MKLARLLFLCLFIAQSLLLKSQSNCTGCYFVSAVGPCSGSYNYTCPGYGSNSAGSYSCYHYARYRAVNSNPFPGLYDNLCNYSGSDISSAADFIRVPSTTAQFAYTSGHANVRNGSGTYTCKVNNDLPILHDYQVSCFGSVIMYMEYFGLIANNGSNNFSVRNVSGLTYQWTISPSCASLTGANTSSVTVSPEFTGTYTLTLKSWHPTFPSNFKTQSINVNFTVNNCQLKGKYQNSSGLYCLSTYNLVNTYSTNITVFCATSGSTISWTKTSGAGSMSSTSGSTNTVYLNAGQSISMDVVARLGSTVLSSRTLAFNRGAFREGGHPDEANANPQEGAEDRAGAVDELNAVAIFPNPASDLLNVAFQSATSQDMTINLYNVTGTLVKSKVIPQGTLVENLSLDLPRSVYLVRLNDGKTTIYTGKVVVQ